MYKCCPSSLIPLVRLKAGSWELVVSSVENSTVVVILPFVVKTFSIVYSNLLMKHGWWWSMSDSWGRTSVLSEIIWILGSPVEMLHWQVFPEGRYCKEDEYGRCRLFTSDYVHASCCSLSIIYLDGWKICGMIYEFCGSAKLGVSVPEFN